MDEGKGAVLERLVLVLEWWSREELNRVEGQVVLWYVNVNVNVSPGRSRSRDRRLGAGDRESGHLQGRIFGRSWRPSVPGPGGTKEGVRCRVRRK